MLGLHDQPSVRTDCRKQTAQVMLGQRNTSFRRLIARPTEVQKHCTAEPLHAAMPIMTDHNHEIVEVIAAPHSFGAGGIRVADMAVVVSITHRIAPAVVRFERLNWQSRARAGDPVSTIVNADKSPGTDRCCPIALAFDDAPA